MAPKRRSLIPNFQGTPDMTPFGPDFSGDEMNMSGGPMIDPETGLPVERIPVPGPGELGPPIMGSKDSAREIFGNNGPTPPQPGPTQIPGIDLTQHIPRGVSTTPDQTGGVQYLGRQEVTFPPGPGAGVPPGMPEPPAPSVFAPDMPTMPSPVAAGPAPMPALRTTSPAPVQRAGAPAALFPEGSRPGGLFGHAGGLMGGGLGAPGRAAGADGPTELMLSLMRLLQQQGQA
jgi:hypothetical protein